MSKWWCTFSILLASALPLSACIIVPETTQRTESTTRVYVNDRAGATHVEVSRPQIIIIQQPSLPYPPPRPEKPRCHIQSNGLSMPHFPTVCD
ncbi:hypothetical protein [Acinetobacter sp. MD2(2019)]|uniref:hypothetical protein n=1 Tax=Acinetobacter sp. MD2(2019) TaxID=2605273 RepID=UPI002D1F4288|nr:hypothetical protein [Acinetobacter sp. MD2(2019)]MEB3753276.1 hypothetical protein [Acinetobacter sp. MD2(2019)]